MSCFNFQVIATILRFALFASFCLDLSLLAIGAYVYSGVACPPSRLLSSLPFFVSALNAQQEVRGVGVAVLAGGFAPPLGLETYCFESFTDYLRGGSSPK